MFYAGFIKKGIKIPGRLTLEPVKLSSADGFFLALEDQIIDISLMLAVHGHAIPPFFLISYIV